MYSTLYSVPYYLYPAVCTSSARQQLIGQATSVTIDFSRQLIMSKINREEARIAVGTSIWNLVSTIA